MVYKELLTLKNIDSPRLARTSNILSVNKQIYNEATGVLYSLNTIEIKLGDLGRLWLRDSPIPFHINARLYDIPFYLRRCEKIRIVLSVRSFDSFDFHRIRPEDTDTLLTNLNSLIYTQLMDHEHLRDIELELQMTGDYDHYIISTVTDEQMRSFERGCLNTFCHLRGMHVASFKGFKFVDPFDVFLAKNTVLLPSVRTWNSFPTIPKMIEAAPQWWQMKNLSKHQNHLLK